MAKVAQQGMTKSVIQAYLRDALGPDVELVGVEPLGQADHDTGISTLLRLHVRQGDTPRQLILRRAAVTAYSTEQQPDRAHGMLQARAIYNRMPRHPRALGVAVERPDGGLLPIPADGEFALLQEFEPGEVYVGRLVACLQAPSITPLDARQALAVADYLTELHGVGRDDPWAYRRALRDTVAGGSGVMGVLGGYADALRAAHHDRLSSILSAFVARVWDLGRHPERLRRVHGDFHPLNVLFADGDRVAAIDASGTGWGEPAFDVGTMLANYYLLYNEPGRLSSPSGRALARLFIDRYAAACADAEALYRVLPLPLARGALIMATTDFFPHRSADERARLIRLAGDLLAAERFDPAMFEA